MYKRLKKVIVEVYIFLYSNIFYVKPPRITTTTMLYNSASTE